jgi:hypothetical protein
MWNHVVKAMPNKNLPILYLPGSENLDEIEAVRRGWDARQLIAIERDRSVLDALRKRSINVIRGDLTTALLNWPDDHLVGVVIADFQSCVCEKVLQAMVCWYQMKALSKSVLVLNLQRGRETKWANETIYAMSNAFGRVSFPEGHDVDPKHRGRHVVFGALRCILQYRIEKMNLRDARLGQCMSEYLQWHGVNMAYPPSYKSNRVVMDSVVVWRTSAHVEGARDPAGTDEAMRRRISAALAIRTARLNGVRKVG